MCKWFRKRFPLPLKCLINMLLFIIHLGRSFYIGGFYCLFTGWFLSLYLISIKRRPWKPIALSKCTKRSCVYFDATLPHASAALWAPNMRGPSQTVITVIRWCHHGLLKQPIMFNSFKWCFITVKMIFTRESAGKSLSPSITAWLCVSATLVPAWNQITSQKEMNPLSKQLICNIKYVF